MTKYVNFDVFWIGERLFFCFCEFASLFENKDACNVAII